MQGSWGTFSLEVGAPVHDRPRPVVSPFLQGSQPRAAGPQPRRSGKPAARSTCHFGFPLARKGEQHPPGSWGADSCTSETWHLHHDPRCGSSWLFKRLLEEAKLAGWWLQTLRSSLMCFTQIPIWRGVQRGGRELTSWPRKKRAQKRKKLLTTTLMFLNLLFGVSCNFGVGSDTLIMKLH